MRFLLPLLLLFSHSVLADTVPVAQLLEAVRSSDWASAHRIARKAGRTETSIAEWLRLRAGEGSATDTLNFLNAHPDWPGLKRLRLRSEPAFETASRRQVLEFFGAHPPQTGEGTLIYARALKSGGNQNEAEASILRAWRTMKLGAKTEAAFLNAYKDRLKPHHAARLDHALWNGWGKVAGRTVPLAPEGWDKLAAARLALRNDEPGVDTLIADVPDHLADDPGLAFERVAWRARRGRTRDAATLLLERSARRDGLGDPNHWADRRRRLGRQLMRDGDYGLAYRVASTHGLSHGSAYADLEWLSGYLALRFLDRSEDALQHFWRFRAAVQTPISLGRAGYWIGRAQDALGEKDAAMIAYELGARYQTSFYGILAAERGQIAFDPVLTRDAPTPDWRDAAFTQSSVYAAALAFLEAGELDYAEWFVTHLSESLDADDVARLAAMVESLNIPHLSVMLGKKMARRGIVLSSVYYALHPLADTEHPVSDALVLAIARRESEFDPGVTSHAGARGLMQLMPGTAKKMSTDLGLEYRPGALLTDWEYNAQLGAAYLDELADRYDGNILLMAAGYNAGPGRADQWLERYGDPRTRRVNVVDWIEHIPFRETRNYVMRVSESLPIYRAQLGEVPLPQSFSNELSGRSAD